jgi:hypothetical protein
VVTSVNSGTSFTMSLPASATGTVTLLSALTYIPAFTVVDIQSDGSVNTVSSGIGVGVLQNDLGPLQMQGTATVQTAPANSSTVKLWTAPGTHNILTSVAVTAGSTYSLVTSGANAGQVGNYAVGEVPFVFKAITSASAGTVGEFELVPAPTDNRQVQYSAPLTGTTVTSNPGAGQLTHFIKPAGTIAALTLVLPTNPVDGQIVNYIFGAAVTALTVTGTVDSSTAITAATAGQKTTFTYFQAEGHWA